MPRPKLDTSIKRAMFSIVIPTHNRLSLLSDAIETIRCQEGADWELVIFDNASTDPIREHVNSLNDTRIRCERSDEFLPVTSSWNRAIDFACGEYVTLLGDDDALTPNYFVKLKEIIEQFGYPDLIYSAIYQFMHPGVAPWDLGGYVADVKNGFFFSNHKTPSLLSSNEANQALAGSLHFSRNFTFNIQAFAFRRAFLARLRVNDRVFQSPFPDYYLANVAFALSDSTVIIPEPLAIAGVSKASFGYTLFNGLEKKGESLLNNNIFDDPIYNELMPRLLPSSAYILNYVITMEYVARATRNRTHLSVDYARYRRLQIYTTIHAALMKLPAGAALPDLYERLSGPERAWAFAIKAILRFSSRLPLLDKLCRRALAMSYYGFQPEQRICARGRYSRAIEIYLALETGTFR
jgi:glycosyltransferase involved in cell wall biosynthesis